MSRRPKSLVPQISSLRAFYRMNPSPMGPRWSLIQSHLQRFTPHNIAAFQEYKKQTDARITALEEKIETLLSSHNTNE